MATASETLAITDVDVEAVKKIPSRYSNRLYVKVEGGNVRLNFGELVEGTPLYHTALTIAAVDAVAFGDLITRVANAAISQAEPAAASPRPGSGNVG